MPHFILHYRLVFNFRLKDFTQRHYLYVLGLHFQTQIPQSNYFFENKSKRGPLFPTPSMDAEMVVLFQFTQVDRSQWWLRSHQRQQCHYICKSSIRAKRNYQSIWSTPSKIWSWGTYNNKILIKNQIQAFFFRSRKQEFWSFFLGRILLHCRVQEKCVHYFPWGIGAPLWNRTTAK